MSEYITVTTENTDNPDCLRLITNLDLAPDGPEHYGTPADGDEGSPLAQTLFAINGLMALDLENRTMTICREPDVEWHDLITDITAALKDFFL